MRYIGINRAKPGDILGQAIYNSDGNIMLREGVVLTERFINKLKSVGATYIYIDDNRLDEIEMQDPKFIQIKSDMMQSLSKSLNKLDSSDTVPKLESTIDIVGNVVEYLLQNKQINAAHLMEIKTYDNYTYVHSLNTSVIAIFFGVQMDLSKSELMDLGTGCLLHDIGKTKIPKTILNKPDRLTKEEFDVMKKHPKFGYEVIQKLRYINERAKKIVIEHHERIDGSGYPTGCKGDEISLFGKIASISDVYDAIISDRIYRKGVSGSEAYEFILGGAGTLFDWNLVNIFKNHFSIYQPGSCVQLSNGVEAFVVKENKGFPDRPVVRVLYDKENNEIEPYDIDLVVKLDICIEGVL